MLEEGWGTGRLPRGIGGWRDGDGGAVEGREADCCGLWFCRKGKLVIGGWESSSAWEVDSDLLTKVWNICECIEV